MQEEDQKDHHCRAWDALLSGMSEVAFSRQPSAPTLDRIWKENTNERIPEI
jgi:hypothetical protein